MFDAKSGHSHVPLIRVLLFNGPEFEVRFGDILKGGAHILEALHQGLLLDWTVLQALAL